MKFIQSLSRDWADRIRKDEVLAPYTYFKIGGPADYFVTVRNSLDLEEIILAAENSKTPWIILGGGSNVLVGDLGFRGLVIKNEAAAMEVNNGLLVAESGVKMANLAAFANENGLSGLEVFMSVPGTLGGAVFNNSHFRPEKGEFIGNLVEEVEILRKRAESRGQRAEEGNGMMERKTVSREWFRFGYDYSRLQDEKAVVLNVKFRLGKELPEKLRERSLALLKERNANQPVGQSSCGCMFKNPAGQSAGKLIDLAGMKGKKIAAAVVSDKHANFIINTGGAKAKEVLELMNSVKTRVKNKTGIELEPEIFMVGEF